MKSIAFTSDHQVMESVAHESGMKENRSEAKHVLLNLFTSHYIGVV